MTKLSISANIDGIRTVKLIAVQYELCWPELFLSLRTFLETDMTNHNNAFMGLAERCDVVNIFNHRVTSRLAPATVYIERPRRDLIVERLTESLQRVAQQSIVVVAPTSLL